MASGCLGDSKPCRTIREGLVQVIHGKHVSNECNMYVIMFYLNDWYTKLVF